MLDLLLAESEMLQERLSEAFRGPFGGGLGAERALRRSRFKVEAMVEAMRIGSLELKVPLAVGTMQWGTTWLDNKLNRGCKRAQKWPISPETCSISHDFHQLSTNFP